MANQVVNVAGYVVKNALVGFYNTTLFTGLVDRDFNREFEERGAKKGDQIFVRKPAQFRIRKGAKMKVQDVKETKIPVKLGEQVGVDFEFSVREATLDIDHGKAEYAKRFVRPAGSRLAADKDHEGLMKASIGAGYTVIPDVSGADKNDKIYKGFVSAKAMLNKMFAPKEVSRRVAFVDSDIETYLADNVSKLFNASNDITKAIKAAGMNDVGVGGLTWGTTDLGYTRVNGAGGQTGTVTFDGDFAQVNGTADPDYDNETQWLTIGIAGLAVGDTLEFDDVFFCNLETKAMYAQKLQRKVLEIGTGANAGKVKVYSIRPNITDAVVNDDGTGTTYAGVNSTEDERKAIRTKQAMANCYCADWAATSGSLGVKVLGEAGETYACCPVMHMSAMKLTSVHLVQPTNTEMCYGEESKGIFIRFIEDYEIRDDILPDRLDMLAEFTILYPEWINVVEVKIS